MATVSPHIVIAFHTTAEALAFQKLAKTSDLSGRLAPIPRQISAGCGFAWREQTCNETLLMELISANDVDYESLTRMDL